MEIKYSFVAPEIGYSWPRFPSRPNVSMVRNVTRIFGVHLHCLSCVRGAFLALASNDGSYCHCLRDVVILAGLRKSRHVVWLQNDLANGLKEMIAIANAPDICFLLQSRKPPWVRLVGTAAPAKLAFVYNSFSFGSISINFWQSSFPSCEKFIDLHLESRDFETRGMFDFQT